MAKGLLKGYNAVKNIWKKKLLSPNLLSVHIF